MLVDAGIARHRWRYGELVVQEMAENTRWLRHPGDCASPLVVGNNRYITGNSGSTTDSSQRMVAVV